MQVLKRAISAIPKVFIVKMHSSKTALLALSTFVANALASPISSACASVHVITARASTELPGEGIIGAVVNSIVTRSTQVISREAVDYPALLFPYGPSEQAGVVAMKAALARKATACPNTKLVLMGYSQGAQVSGDVLASQAPGTDKGYHSQSFFSANHLTLFKLWLPY